MCTAVSFSLRGEEVSDGISFDACISCTGSDDLFSGSPTVLLLIGLRFRERPCRLKRKWKNGKAQLPA